MSQYKYSLEKLQNIAEDLADKASPPFSILLNGEVGAGKTAFSKFFIGKLIIDKNQSITSPTFNIVQIYETIKGGLWHVDLYRLEEDKEIFELGLLEAMQECICLIEWPERIKKYISTSFNYMEFDL